MTNQEKEKATPPSPRRPPPSRHDRVLAGGARVAPSPPPARPRPGEAAPGRPVAGRRPPIWLIVAAGLALVIVLPGPFWGAFDAHGWWWGWGAGWLLLGAAALWAYIALRDRDRPPPTGGPGGPAAGKAEATSQGAVSNAPGERGDAAPERG